MRDLHEGILLEFTERAATSEASVPYGYRLIVVGRDIKLPSGAEYRASGLCPDCGKAPAESRMRCVTCARKNAINLKEYRRIRKAAA